MLKRGARWSVAQSTRICLPVSHLVFDHHPENHDAKERRLKPVEVGNTCDTPEVGGAVLPESIIDHEVAGGRYNCTKRCHEREVQRKHRGGVKCCVADEYEAHGRQSQ